MRKLRGIMGAINSPHNIYLLQRGLKTFELRMQRHNENGQAVAEFLASHPRVEKVYYPGPRFASVPRRCASATMRGFGGLVTFLVKDADWRANGRRRRCCEDSADRPQPGRRRVADRAAADHELLRVARRRPQRYGIPDNMIRLACGIENSDDLIADLEQAWEGCRVPNSKLKVQGSASQV